MLSNDTESDQVHVEYVEYSKIVEKFSGMCVNGSPCPKHGEVLQFNKLDPSKFFDVQFKSFGQQQDFTRKAFTFCTNKNTEEMQVGKLVFKGLGQPVKKKKLPHLKAITVGDDSDDDPEYKPPRNIRRVAGANIDWTLDLDDWQQSVHGGLDENDFLRAMQQDTNVVDEVSITLDEGDLLVDSSVQPSLLLDDFGGESLPPEDIERQLMESLPAEVRRSMPVFFRQNRTLLENVSQQPDLVIPMVDPIPISPLIARRDVQTTDIANLTAQNDENLIILPSESRKRTSKSPRQPLAHIDVNVIDGPAPIDPINIQAAPDQINVIPAAYPIDELPPQQQVVQEQEVVVQPVEVQNELGNEQFPEIVDFVVDGRPRRPRRVQGSLAEHQVASHRLLQKKRHRRGRLIDVDLDETVPSVRQTVTAEHTIAVMEHTVQAEANNLFDQIENIRSPQSDAVPQLDPPIILRPSDAHIRNPIPPRHSSIVDDIQSSSIPLMPTVNNSMIEQQQHVDSAVLNTQYVNEEIIQIQRSSGRRPRYNPANGHATFHEVPTNEQIRQMQDSDILVRMQNTPQRENDSYAVNNMFETPDPIVAEPPAIQSIVPPPTTDNEPEPAQYTRTEKRFLEVFFNILALKTSTGRSEFLLSDVLEADGGRASTCMTMATLLKLTWEQPQMIDLIKASNTNAVTHVKLIGFDED